MFFVPCTTTNIKLMKGSRFAESRQSKQGHVNTPRPDIRDEMDSRKDKEPGFEENDNRPARKRKKNIKNKR
jgi:hypothetical protein